MKEWRSKYGRIPELEILQSITKDGTDGTCRYFLIEGVLCTVEGEKIYWEMMDDDNLCRSIKQYLKLKQINLFDSFAELEKHIEQDKS